MTTAPLKNALEEPFSEVIFSTNELITAQCYKESKPGSSSQISLIQGSLVKVKSSYDTSYEAFGIITKINNSSLDNIHRPSALGLNPEELERLQPQVYDLLKKELEILLFAHKDLNGCIINYPPTKPMMIHDFVYLCSNKEIIELTSDLSSLINLIKKLKLKPEILIEPITYGYKLRNNDYNYLVKAGQLLSLAFSDEIESLMQVLKRLSEHSKT